jgi:iron complex outermembrane receptor protein
LGTRHPDGSGNVCPDFGPGQLDFEQNTSCISRNGGATGEPATDPSASDWNTITSTFGTEDLSTFGFYAKFDYDFDRMTLNLVAAFDNLDYESAFDSDGGPTVGNHFAQADDRDTVQYEGRLVSAGDGGFRWIAGFYYLDEDGTSFTGIRTPQFGAANRYPNVQLRHSKENLGIYAQTEFDITDRFTLTTGLRWSDEELVGNYLPSNPSVAGIDTNTPLFAADVDSLVGAQADPTDPNQDGNGYDVRRQVTRKVPNDDTGYTIKLDWAVTDSAMLYASYSKGFKGGALDTRAAFALLPPGNIQDEIVELKPESLNAFELGYKASFMENRIQLDLAGFFYKYEDLQQFSNIGGMPALINAPESEVIGLDANLKYANDSGFYLDLGLSLLDTEITDATDSPFAEGEELANSPPVSFFAVAAKDFELGSGNLLTLMANASFTDDTIKQTLVTAQLPTKALRTQPSYTLIDASATYRFGGDRQYSLALWGKNLTDERYCGFIGVNEGPRVYLDGDVPGFSFTATCRVDTGSSRTYGVGFNVEF